MTAALEVNSTVARARVDRIKTGVEVIWSLIVESYEARDWLALGYSSWDDMCTREFGTARLRLPREERAETVQSLRDSGLSLRAIAAVTGESKDTVARAIAPVSYETPEPTVDRVTGEVLDDEPVSYEPGEVESLEAEVAAAMPAPEPAPVQPITGLDGKTYNPQPKPDPRKPPRKPLTEVAKTRGFALRQATGAILRIFEDDRAAANEKQVADALRGHLLYVAETVAAVLDQLP